MGYFNRSFVALRARNGFKTAYNYYHSNGGRRVFPFTYAHYLKIERGGSLPKPSALAVMLKLLRRAIPPEEHKKLTRDYLRDLSGDAAVYDELFAPLLVPENGSYQENTLSIALERLTDNLTPAQFKAIVSSSEATGCFMLLSNIPNALSSEKIAELIGSSKANCLAAIGILRRQRLVVVRGLDHYAFAIPAERRCRLPNPHGFKPLYDKMRKNIDRIAGKHGVPFYGRSASIRLEPSARDRLTGDLEAAFTVGSSLSAKMLRPGPETPLYYIEARVRRLVAFPPVDETARAQPTPRPESAKRPAAVKKLK